MWESKFLLESSLGFPNRIGYDLLKLLADLGGSGLQGLPAVDRNELSGQGLLL